MASGLCDVHGAAFQCVSMSVVFCLAGTASVTARVDATGNARLVDGMFCETTAGATTAAATTVGNVAFGTGTPATAGMPATTTSFSLPLAGQILPADMLVLESDAREAMGDDREVSNCVGTEM